MQEGTWKWPTPLQPEVFRRLHIVVAVVAWSPGSAGAGTGQLFAAPNWQKAQQQRQIFVLAGMDRPEMEFDRRPKVASAAPSSAASAVALAAALAAAAAAAAAVVAADDAAAAAAADRPSCCSAECGSGRARMLAH